MRIPTQDKIKISASTRSKSNNLIKFIFKTCPNCGNYSFKPNMNLGSLLRPTDVYRLVEAYGRSCRICRFMSFPNKVFREVIYDKKGFM